MKLMLSLTFPLILLTYLAGHAVVYFSLVKFFAISLPAAKESMIAILTVLAMSYFASAATAHFFENFLTRVAYLLSSLWMGLLVHLVVFFALAWVIFLIGPSLNFVPKEKTLAILALLATFFFSAYGIWNAFTPNIISLNVAVDSLPKQWIGKKIVQISDVHLGHVYRQGHLTEVVKKINAINPEIVVITGDLFDAVDGNTERLTKPLEEVKAPIYFVTGNHETYLGLEKSYAKIAKTKIIPLRDSLVNLDGLQLVGIDYPLRGKNRDIAEIIPKMEGYDQFAPSILLIHEPLQIESAKKLEIALQLSGHTHHGQLFPFGFIPKIIFGGYDYGFKREGHFAIYTSAGLGGWGPPMRTAGNSEIVEITLL